MCCRTDFYRSTSQTDEYPSGCRYLQWCTRWKRSSRHTQLLTQAVCCRSKSKGEGCRLCILLASLIETNFSKKLKRKSRGVKQASLWVIHQTAMPSVLIETGFVTNKNEGSYLNSKKGQSEISNAIKDAILDYKHSLDMNIGGNVVPIETNNPTVSIDESKQIYEGVIFKVQIAASSRKLEPKSYNFNGLDDISREDLGDLYKYYYGNTSDYNEIKQLQIEAKQKGYSSCFIVAYKNGKQVSVSEVLNSSTN